MPERDGKGPLRNSDTAEQNLDRGCRRLGGQGKGLGHGRGMGNGAGRRGNLNPDMGRGQGMGQGPCRKNISNQTSKNQ